MAKYKDTAGNIIEVGNPALNPDLIAGKTLVPDSTSITSGAPAPAAAAPSSIDASIADNQARAKALGITIPGIGDRPSPVVSSSTVRNDLTERGADPNTANFSSEDAYRRFVEQVQPKTAAPAASSLVDTYTGLTTKYGIDKLQSDLSALDDESAAIDAELRTFKAKESDRQSAGFVRGRISEAERTTLERQSYLTQQKNVLVNRIKTANDSISTIMTLTGKDYENARGVYEFEYNKNLATLQAFQKTQTEAKTEEERVANETRDDARAKLTTIYNQLSTGGASVDSLTASQQATIQQLELQAGFPTGFFESIQRANPKSDIISTTTREADGRKYADVVTRGADGALSVDSIPLGVSDGGGEDGSVFTNTQLNIGAANAGMPIAEFKQLDADTKNWFINSYGSSQLESDVSAVKNGGVTKDGSTKQEVTANIRSAVSIPDAAKQIILKGLGAGTADAATDTGGESAWSAIGSWLGNLFVP